MARPRKGERKLIRCYLCGHGFEVSARTMSTTCPKCNKAIKVEDLNIKSYMPVNDVQTCGRISVAKRGRVAARQVSSGEGISCDGSIEASVSTEGPVTLGPKATWRGKLLRSGSLVVSDGAVLVGRVTVPWNHNGANTPPEPTKPGASTTRRPTSARTP